MIAYKTRYADIRKLWAIKLISSSILFAIDILFKKEIAHFPDNLQLLPKRLVSKANKANIPVKSNKVAAAF